TAPIPLLAGWEAARAVERFGGRLRGLARALPSIHMLVAPELWLSALYYGHIEQMIAVWLSLAAIRMLSERRAWAAGALLGLALLARSDVALLILPIALTLVARRRLLDVTWLAVGGALTTVAGLAPFLLADRSDTLFSLVTFRAALPVGGGNIWSLSDAPAFLEIGQRYDAALVVGAATLLTLLFLVTKRALTVTAPDFLLLLAVSALCFPLLIKTLWPYYYQEAALFATVWAMARAVAPLSAWRAWSRSSLVGAIALLWLPRLVILGLALLAEYGLEATSYDGWLPPWGVIVGSANIAVLALTVATLIATPSVLALLAPEPAAPQRAILPEVAQSAPAEGGS
ncbi:MAG: hypothetical protein ACRDID_13590, partial [Ktedonobacterales bacterium]